MNQRFLNTFQFDEQLCVDESMIPYFGKYSAKQYIKGSRSIKIRHKVWCLNTNNGYLIQCDPYSGNSDYNSELRLGGSVVTKLIWKLPSDFKFSVKFSNLHTLALWRITKLLGIKAAESLTSDTILPIKSLLLDGMTITL